MKFKKWSLVALSAAVVLLSNCKGKDGEIGPSGQTGPVGGTGQQGPTGPAGPSGTNGTNGTNGEIAKVFITTVTSASWSATSTGLQTVISVAGITSDIETNGFVLVYVRNTANTAWVSVSNTFAAGTDDKRYFFTYSLGIVNVYYESSATTLPTAPSDRAFKIVYMKGQAARMERSELEELYK